MADPHELKDLYKDIEVDEAEIARFRSHLAARLPARPPARPAWRWAWAGAWAGASLLAGLAIWTANVTAPLELDDRDLQSLRSMVETAADPLALRTKAESLRSRGNELAHLNADTIICLTQPNGGALQTAARGAAKDPRPEFRAFYLEYLLDHADSYQLNADEIEGVMDREADVVCLELFDRLLRMASHAWDGEREVVG